MQQIMSYILPVLFLCSDLNSGTFFCVTIPGYVLSHVYIL